MTKQNITLTEPAPVKQPEELHLSEKKEKLFRMIIEIQKDIESLFDERKERSKDLLCKRCQKTVEEFDIFKKQLEEDS